VAYLDGRFEERQQACHIPRMSTKRLKRPRDPIQLGKLIVDIAVGEIDDHVEDDRDSAAVALGKKGGKARAEKLSPEQRSTIARRAAQRRWRGAPRNAT
jgi:hypothetical protein